MVQRVVLDTDMLSEILKGVNPIVSARAQEYGQKFGSFDFTSCSVLEILHGLYRIGSASKAQRAEVLFAANNEIVPERADFRLAAQIAGGLAIHGTPIGIIDPLIAACAIRRGFGVATGNAKHYEYIRAAGFVLHLENWRNA